ncbi:hypothetical protein BDV11DRAFT_179650 [Aspergillus similis]
MPLTESDCYVSIRKSRNPSQYIRNVLELVMGWRWIGTGVSSVGSSFLHTAAGLYLSCLLCSGLSSNLGILVFVYLIFCLPVVLSSYVVSCPFLSVLPTYVLDNGT